MSPDTGRTLRDWQIVRALDSGAQAKTFLVERGGQVGVAKCLLPLDDSKAINRDEQLRRFLTEVNILTSLQSEGCPRIVPVLDTNVHTVMSNTDETAYYVMPYFVAGPLRS